MREACCYALQDKFRLTDPGGTRREIDIAIEDLEAEAACGPTTACCAS